LATIKKGEMPEIVDRVTCGAPVEQIRSLNARCDLLSKLDFE
jgi:hypothetical protein